MRTPEITIDNCFIQSDGLFYSDGDFSVTGEQTHRNDIALCALYIDNYEADTESHFRNNETPGFFDQKALHDAEEDEDSFIFTDNYIRIIADSEQKPPTIKNISFNFEMPSQNFIDLRNKFWDLIDTYEDQIKACINDHPETVPLLKKQVSMILNHCAGQALTAEYDGYTPD